MDGNSIPTAITIIIPTTLENIHNPITAHLCRSSNIAPILL